MQFLAATLALSALALAAPSPPPSYTKYYLKTMVKSGNASLGGLYLSTAHSGAAQNDAVLLPGKTNAVVGYLVQTNSSEQNGHYFYNQRFDSGLSEPYELVMDYAVNVYAEWQPTAINIGGIGVDGSSSDSNFWLDYASGLQWTRSPDVPNSDYFSGWLVCEWWRGAPQLFYNVDGFGKTPLSSCANVNLIPDPIV